MAPYARLFVPNYCRRGWGCKLHVHLHGCYQAESEHAFENDGFMHQAINNDIMILWPLVLASENTHGPHDVLGNCWSVDTDRKIEDDY
jgi:hypothetical protein